MTKHKHLINYDDTQDYKRVIIALLVKRCRKIIKRFYSLELEKIIDGCREVLEQIYKDDHAKINEELEKLCSDIVGLTEFKRNMFIIDFIKNNPGI